MLLFATYSVPSQVAAGKVVSLGDLSSVDFLFGEVVFDKKTFW